MTFHLNSNRCLVGINIFSNTLFDYNLYMRVWREGGGSDIHYNSFKI